MIVAGVDPSITGTGLALVGPVPGAASTRRVRTVPGLPLVDRMRYTVGEAVAFCLDADVIVIEGLSLGSKGSATRDLAGLWWMLVDALTRPVRLYPRRDHVVVAPGTLKLWATGDGRAGKAEVREHIMRRWHIAERISYDEADALALASMGLHHAGCLPWTATPAQERAVRAPSWPAGEAA